MFTQCGNSASGNIFLLLFVCLKQKPDDTHLPEPKDSVAWSDEPPFLLKLQMVDSQFGTKCMNPRSQPALCQQSKLLLIV